MGNPDEPYERAKSMTVGSCNKAFLSVALVLLAGCASWFGGRSSKYETISGDPMHDTQAARRANEAALRHWTNGELGKAEAKFKKALAADVAFGPAHNNLGKLYFELGNLYLAAWEFEYATKLMPDRPEPHSNLGLVLEAVGRLDEAIANYETAYRLAPTNPQFVGNLARARLRMSESDPTVRPLLGELLLVETRPEWRHWAMETLALGDLPCPVNGGALPATSIQEPPGTAEVISPPFPEETLLDQMPTIGSENTQNP